MDDFALTSGVISEFFKYLNAQLKEAREQLQRTNEENSALKAQLEVLRFNAATSGSSTTSNEHECFRDEVNHLCKELSAMRETAKRHEAEAATWRTRYEELKPQLAQSSAYVGQTLERMRKELADSVPQASAGDQTLTQFRTLLRSLPGIAAIAPPEVSRQVFSGTILPLMSKASKNACIGGFCFFGDLLKWSTPPSQHAFVIFPEYRYNPKPPDDEPTWTLANEWASIAGQQRELLYVDDGSICYAGTFLCHAGPQSVKVEELGDDIDESYVQALARKSFNVMIKHAQSRHAKAKAYVPLLADLYTEGTATVRILGLQRVGFNEKLFQILRRAYEKRDRKAPSSASASVEAEADASPTGPKGRKRDLMLDLLGEPNEVEWNAPGPSKVPRLDSDEGAALHDEMTLWRA